MWNLESYEKCEIDDYEKRKYLQETNHTGRKREVDQTDLRLDVQQGAWTLYFLHLGSW